MGSILMIALLAGVAFFVVRFFLRRKTPSAQPADAMQFAGIGGLPAMSQPPEPAPLFASSAPSNPPVVQRVPAGFDSEGFLRVAKLNFIRLQAANDAKNLDDMREFVSPEMFAELKMQMDERGNTPQQTDVVTLQTELLEVTTEANRHIASVHFSGMIREAVGAAPAPFNEVWNLSKPVEGSQGWVISGIQQLT
jgi:predicted lipid-binding transport protein (Tim44 family)